VTFADGTAMRVTSDWTPGALRSLMIDGAPLVLKTGKIPGGFRVRTRGADLKVHVRSPRHAS
jgi:propionyl-CoA carboxylase alpha chain